MKHLILAKVFIILLFFQTFYGQKKTKKPLVRYKECGGTLLEDQAIVVSPNYPSNISEANNTYSSNLNCEWKKSTNSANTLYSIKMWDMVIENRPISPGSNITKCYDYLNISIASIGTKQYCRWKPPTEIIRGVGQSLTLFFHSNDIYNYRGFLLAYSSFPDYNPCVNKPCFKGKCSAKENKIDFKCTCPPGFTGVRCEIDIKECESQPCQNGGTCIEDKGGGFNCRCFPGWKGKTCNENVNECESDPCENGASCLDKVNLFECTCALGWEGIFCENKIDLCKSDPCESFEVCDSDGIEYSCTCPAGYTGESCSHEITVCDSEPCNNGAICELTNETFKCLCKPGYSGITCDIAPLNCQNPGIPYLSESREWSYGDTLQFYCADGYHLVGKENLTCQQDANWTSPMPICVDNNNTTIPRLPFNFTRGLLFLISLTIALTIAFTCFSIWLIIKGPWKIGKRVTKVMKLSRISLSSY